MSSVREDDYNWDCPLFSLKSQLSILLLIFESQSFLSAFNIFSLSLAHFNLLWWFWVQSSFHAEVLITIHQLLESITSNFGQFRKILDRSLYLQILLLQYPLLFLVCPLHFLIYFTTFHLSPLYFLVFSTLSFFSLSLDIFFLLSSVHKFSHQQYLTCSLTFNSSFQLLYLLVTNLLLRFSFVIVFKIFHLVLLPWTY